MLALATGTGLSLSGDLRIGAGNATFDLVLTDYLMPQMDGLQLAGEIKRLGTSGSIPVVLVSSAAVIRGLSSSWRPDIPTGSERSRRSW